MKILFLMEHFGSIRLYESVVRLLAEKRHDVHLVSNRKDKSPVMQKTVENLAAEYPTVSWSHCVTSEQVDYSIWLGLANVGRIFLDYLRFLYPQYNNTPKLHQRARERVPDILVSLTRLWIFRNSVSLRLLTAFLKMMERAIPSNQGIERFLEGHQPDVILITPLVLLGADQLDYLKSAKALGMRTIWCVGSWDHLSSKGWARILPDRITVWNETQKMEAMKMHGIPPDRIVVTGAQCYDQWFEWKPSRPREEFCRTVGLAPDKPFLLYVASALFPESPSEPEFARKWIQQIRSSDSTRLKEAGILIRPHPIRIDEWEKFDFSEFENLAFWGSFPVDTDAKCDYFDSLYYSAAVVGLNTSTFIEAGIVGQPVYTVLLPEFWENQEGTLHFPYLLHVNGGLLHASRSLDEHLLQLSEIFSGSGEKSEKSRRFIDAFVCPQGHGVPATPIFVDAVEQLGNMPSHPARRRFWHYGIRFLLYPLALIINMTLGKQYLVRPRKRLLKEKKKLLKQKKRLLKEKQKNKKKGRIAQLKKYIVKRLTAWRKDKREI